LVAMESRYGWKRGHWLLWEINGCYGNSMTVIASHWMLWKVTGCESSLWLLWKRTIGGYVNHWLLCKFIACYGSQLLLW
jgi:hypothetical protein